MLTASTGRNPHESTHCSHSEAKALVFSGRHPSGCCGREAQSHLGLAVAAACLFVHLFLPTVVFDPFTCVQYDVQSYRWQLHGCPQNGCLEHTGFMFLPDDGWRFFCSSTSHKHAGRVFSLTVWTRVQGLIPVCPDVNALSCSAVLHSI